MFARMKSLLTKKAGFLSNKRKIQQEADALRVLILSEYQRKEMAKTTDDISPDTTKDTVQAYTMDELLDTTQVGEVSLRDWLSDLSHNEVLSYNQRNLHHQVIKIFRSLHQVHQELYNSSVSKTDVDGDQQQMHHRGMDAADARGFAKSQDTSPLHTMLETSCGFCLDVGTSKVSTETKNIDGVFVRGDVRAGSVVGFFPGVTYLRDRVHAGDFKARLDERGGRSDYVYMRPDRSLVDGSQRVGKLNPYSLGHLIRHPSTVRIIMEKEEREEREGKEEREREEEKEKDSNRMHPGAGAGAGAGGRNAAQIVAAPNVITYPFDYPIEHAIEKEEEEGDHEEDPSASNYFPTELRPYIPNAYSSPPGMLSPESAKESFAQGAVIVAVRDLKDGEEIFCDYRLNPKVSLPKWYCPVDEKRAENFWD